MLEKVEMPRKFVKSIVELRSKRYKINEKYKKNNNASDSDSACSGVFICG